MRSVVLGLIFLAGSRADDLLRIKSALQECHSILKPLQDGAIELEEVLEACRKNVSINMANVKLLEEGKELEMNELLELRNRNSKIEDKFANKDASLEDLRFKIVTAERNSTQLAKLATTYRSRNAALNVDLETALALLEDEKEVSEKLRSSLKKLNDTTTVFKDEIRSYKRTPIAVTNQNLKSENQNLTMELSKLREEVAVLKETVVRNHAIIKEEQVGSDRLESDLKRLKEQLERSKEELSVVSINLVDEREQGARNGEKLEDAMKQITILKSENLLLRDRSEQARGTIDKLDEQQKLVHQESEALKSKLMAYKQKLDDPALFDVFMAKADFLKNRKANGVDFAYEKTMRYIGPKLGPTHQAMLEMQQLVDSSSQRLTRALGKPEYSPVLSGFLTYGVLLLPLVLSLIMLVRLKKCLSLVKTNMWMNTYNMLFCFVLFASSFWLGDRQEPMAALRQHNEQSFEFLQLVIPMYYGSYLLMGILLVLRNAFVLRCKSLTRVLLIVILPVAIMIHYYSNVWYLAMQDMPPVLTCNTWLYYGFMYLANCFFIIFGSPPSSTSVHSDNKSGDLEEAISINLDAQILDPVEVQEKVASALTSRGKQKTKKSSKKSK